METSDRLSTLEGTLLAAGALLLVTMGGFLAALLRRNQRLRQAGEEQETLVALVENSADIIGVSTLDGKILYLNKAGQKILGIDGLEAARKTRLEEYTLPRHAGPYREAVEILRKTGRWQGEARIRHFKTGRPVPVYVNAFIIEDPATGRPMAMANVSRDITELKRMEAELIKAQKLESLGVLAGGIAHDFNNLLTVILGHIILAKTEVGPGTRVCEQLEEAEKASVRAKDLTRQLLTFSRGGAPVKRTVSIGDLVRESAAFGLTGTNTRCEVLLPEGLWAVDADEGQMSQVIHNLILNAHQAMAHGGVIRLSCENRLLDPEEVPPLPAGRYVCISVADTGTGISPDDLPKIFDPYFTTKKGGSGLGLATSYSIVRKHGGHISVESEPGAGATARVYLPASERVVPFRTTAPDPPWIGKGRILVMDDNEAVLEVVKGMLNAIGYNAVLARAGEEAVDLYRESLEKGEPFFAVIMDLTVPGGMGGAEAIGLLRRIDPGVKAIVSSGYSTAPVMAEYEEYGFSGVVAKPYTLKQLGDTLRRLGNP